MSTSAKYVKGINRAEAIKQGAYDGRFAPRAIPNKRKERAKKACRGRVQW